jgi:hypothetical protein
MKINNKMRITPIDEVNWGMYMWQMPDDTLVMNEEGAYLSIPSIKGDIRQIKKLKVAAKNYGLDEGQPIFFSGHRPVTDEELSEQKSRMDLGLVPDTQDLPAMMEYFKEAKEMGL